MATPASPSSEQNNFQFGIRFWLSATQTGKGHNGCTRHNGHDVDTTDAAGRPRWAQHTHTPAHTTDTTARTQRAQSKQETTIRTHGRNAGAQDTMGRMDTPVTTDTTRTWAQRTRRIRRGHVVDTTWTQQTKRRHNGHNADAMWTQRGFNGRNGHNGRNGNNGHNGHNGHNGFKGRNGNTCHNE